MEVLVPFLFSVSDGLSGIDFLCAAVAFVTHQHDDRILRVDTVILHDGLPLAQIIEALSVLEVEHQQDHLRISVERVPNFLIIGTSTEIEEVDCYFAAGDRDFFDTVIHADSGDVLLNESALTVTFDYA